LYNNKAIKQELFQISGVVKMKKCPVCGVMMGDNVARCSMCKYDFQKASGGDVNAAIQEAQKVLSQKEEENIARAEAKKTEEEKRLAEIKEKLTREAATLQDTFDSQKLKLESEFAQMQKEAIDEKLKIEKELEEQRNTLIDLRDTNERLKKENENFEAESKAKAQREYDEMIDLAKKEQQRIITEAQQQTEELAIQVEKEYAEAMAKRDEVLAEAKELQDFCDNADKVKQEKEAEIAQKEAEIKKLGEDFEKEKKRIAEESEKISMEQASEALKIKDAAEAERAAIEKEKEQIIAEIEKRQTDAQAELDGLVEQAKEVISQAEEATARRDELVKELEEVVVKKEAAEKDTKAAVAQKEECEKKIREFEKQGEEWAKQIEGIKADYENAQAVIADSKNATVQAEAEAQQIILNAEKQSVFLKEVALSESEKGAMLKEIEEKNKTIEEKKKEVKELKMQKEELEKKLEALDKSIADLEKKVREGAATAAVADAGPKEYSVEIVPHNSVGEVDSDGISKALTKKSADGWKLNSIINDEGGKLQASLGTSEAAGSLSMGAYTSKEDRVILIFERAKKK
jgi:chromosome segregation ATPase